MNVSELFILTLWITTEIIDTQIQQKYQTLQTILQQQTQPNREKHSFETQKDDLINTLESVSMETLTKDQIKFLEKLNIAQAIGNEGINAIEDILYKNVIDVATSAQKLQKIYQNLNQGIKKTNQIKTGLEGCVLEEKYEADDNILMRVSFTGQANMSNVTDFKKWGQIWFDIGRGIAMAHGYSPEEIKVIGATKGSIIIELAVFPNIALTVSGIIFAALKVADKVLDLRKKAEEIRGLKLQNDKLSKDIEKEAEKEKNIGLEKIASNIIKKLKLKTDTEGDKVNALTKAVNNLVNFIEKGGEVDFIIPEENVEEDNKDKKHNYTELRVAFQEIRKLEYKLALLEHKK